MPRATHPQSAPMDVDSDPPLSFPGPGYMQGATDSEEKLTLAGKSKAELKELCKRFRLAVGGNKPALYARLQSFSADKEKWKGLLPRMHQKHLGPMEGRVTKKKKTHLAKRIEKMHAEHEAGSGQPSVGPSLVSSEDRQEAVLHWARDVVKRHPYVSLEERVKPAALRGVPFVLPPSYPSTSAPTISSSLSTFPTLPTERSVPSVPPSSQLETAPVQRSLTLANGKVLLFTLKDIPPPPSAQFSKDIPLLGRMWDDRLSGWDGHSFLKIKNEPIAVVYWKEVYSARHWSGNTNHWHTLKPRWSDWKKVALRWKQGTPDQFWSRFSDSEGKHMDYTAILHAIQDDRRKEDKALVRRAREEYGSRFDEVFSYRKGHNKYVLKKDVDIAKKYRSLRGGGNTSDSD